MPKRVLTPSEAYQLRQALQLFTLDALMSARRWGPSDLVFQGGTSLHLAHGSPRFSEDLDFLVRRDVDPQQMQRHLQATLEAQPWLPRDMRVTVKPAKAEHNPVALTVVLAGDDVVGAVRVKLELWKTPQSALGGVRAFLAPVRLMSGPAAGAYAHVPTAELEEIFADKVFALAARDRLKPRDVFDLHFIAQSAPTLPRLSADAMRIRFETYPGMSEDAWEFAARNRKAELEGASHAIHEDLVRWVPKTLPLGLRDVIAMVSTASGGLVEGLDALTELRGEATPRASIPTPCPCPCP